jgi:hypothetical protein
MRVFTLSEKTNIQDEEHIDSINIFCQFFVNPNKERQLEITTCLKKNVENKYITKIYLLNERVYTDEELEITSDKIIQINIGHRLKFKDVFEYINNQKITGYNVIINSDIFFDENIKNLFRSELHLKKKMYALLRYEYNTANPEKTYLFGPRGDSQDTWIVHSNFSVTNNECKMFHFEFGKPGCDNKMTYLMSVLGYEIINDPSFIMTFHLHESNLRNYTAADTIPEPYEILMPNKEFEELAISNPNLKVLFNPKYNHKNSNMKLFEYISNKINSNIHFIIPRVSHIETKVAVFSIFKDQDLESFLKTNKNIMKHNAGIKISSVNSMIKYSNMYLEAFNISEIYSSWPLFGNFFNSCWIDIKINDEQRRFNFIKYLEDVFKTKETLQSEVFDIYHYIYGTPWTFALKNKRLLMVSNFEESIKEKIDNRKKIYGVDLFPDCNIITIRPPQTQGEEYSREFDVELEKFTKKLDKIKNDYDIALVSCGGYGNLVCSHIYKSGKSAIYVGGVLQMYWGILGSRWFKDRPDIIRLFLNEHWTRPKDSEKPKNYKNIENSCYW